MSEPLIKTVHLKKYFETSRGLLHAVDDVNMSIFQDVPWGSWGNRDVEVNLGRLLLRLIEPTSGQIFLKERT